MGPYSPRAALLGLSLLATACAHAAPRAPHSLQEVPAEHFFARGMELANQGEFVPAEQFLQAARARGYPEDTVIRELIKVCLAGSRLDSALGHALPYLERNPDAWALRQVVATIYMSRGEGHAARMELDEVIATEPAQPEPHYLLAVVLRDEYGDPESASVSFEKYLTLAEQGQHAAEVRAWLRRRTRSVPSLPPEEKLQ